VVQCTGQKNVSQELQAEGLVDGLHHFIIQHSYSGTKFDVAQEAPVVRPH
jgi:hypothetical protein